jgi:cytochrome P450
MTIGGGLNEPRDSLAVSIHAMFANPEQRARVEADPALWRRVFEESIRWIAPIGMYPRQVAKPVRLGGVDLKPGDRLGIVLGSGNRDESVYENAENFDIGRGRGHLAFGGGPHFCLGAWAARAQVAEVALPTLFKRLPNLRAAGEPRWGGWVFRGVLDLPARWDR